MFNTSLKNSISLTVLSAIAFVVITMGFYPMGTEAATLLSDDFGTGGTINDVPGWEEQGNDSDSDVVALSPSGSGEDTASPNGGRFAKIARDEWMCRQIDATGYTSLLLSYYWRGDNDAESSDKGEVEYKTSGNCDTGSSWTSLKSHDLSIDNSWSTQSAFALPSALNNATFNLRFRANSSSNDEYFRVDNVVLTATETDACPNVPGTQSSGPCADDICEDEGGTWNGESCDFPPPPSCPEGWTGEFPICIPPAPETCPEGTVGIPPVCVPIPIDACPLDEGFQVVGPCESDDVCPDDEGIQTNEEDCTQEPDAEIPAGGGGEGGGSMVFVDGGSTDPSPLEGIIFCWGVPCAEQEKTDSETSEETGGSTETGELENAVGGPDEEALSCMAPLTSYIGFGNDHEDDVKFLQGFLNNEMGSALEVDGVFGDAVKDVVRAFQLKYASEILAPWVPFGLSDNEPTGLVYKTTQRMINILSCPGTDIPMPELP